jgi:tetratricopeptide (TPR) repeat protein
MADVFISYASEDRARVRPLAEALQAKGFSVWWDRSLAAGQDYTAIIERELRGAKAVVVIWTQSSTLSTFVRDEAGRARDQGRLVPVTFDAVELPLGFGAFQAEDFTRWNGGADAAQMQILVETLRAKIEGRDVNGAEIARKRRRLMARVRLVSVLTVIALIVAIAVGGRLLVAPPQQEPDLRAELLRLLAEGQLTPEQAIQLAQILETGALGEAESASVDARSSGAAPDPLDLGIGVELATVSEAEFDASARDVWRAAFNAVARHPEASVRLAAAQLTQDGARDAAMQSLWDYAAANPDDPLREDIYLLCAAVGEANGNPLGVRALEMATAFDGRDTNVWRMLSRAYERLDRDSEAAAAASISQNVGAAETGDVDAERRLQEAAQVLTAPEVRAEVTSELGRIAEARGDFASASARFAQAYSLRERSLRDGDGVVAEAVQADAQMLVRSLDRAGRTREACERLRQAQEAHDVAAPDQDLLDRCQRQYRVPLRARVELAPRLRESEDRTVSRSESSTLPSP